MYFKYFENTDPYAKLILIPPEVEELLRSEAAQSIHLCDSVIEIPSISNSIKNKLRNLKNNASLRVQQKNEIDKNSDKNNSITVNCNSIVLSKNNIKNNFKNNSKSEKNGNNNNVPVVSLTGKQILEYIAADNPYLQKYNPITGLLHYGGGVFQKVKDDDIFFLPLSNSAPKDVELLSFHVQRDIPVDQLHVQSTLLFSSVAGAFHWLEQAKAKIGFNFQIRVFHPGYMGFFRICDTKGNFVKIEDSILRLGTMKLMLERVVNEEERKHVLDAWEGVKLRQIQIKENEEEGEEGEGEIDTITNKNLDDLNEKIADFEIIDWEVYKNAILQEKGFSIHADYELTYKNSYHSTDEFKRKEIIRAKNWSKAAIPQSPKYVTRKLKLLIRKGITEASRKDVWLGVTGGLSFLRKDAQLYENTFKKIFSGYINNLLSYPDLESSTTTSPSSPLSKDSPTSTDSRSRSLSIKESIFFEVNPRIYPEFGGKLYLDKSKGCYLNESGKSAAKRVLCVLSEMDKEIDCCPTIPDIVQALLLVMTEHDAFACLYAMLTISKRTQWYFRTSRIQHTLYIETFTAMITIYVPEVGNHFNSIKYDMTQLAEEWLTRSFFSFFPLHILLRLLDGFMYEGTKIFYRAGFAVLKILSKHIVKCISTEKMTELIIEKMKLIQEDDLFYFVYNFNIRRKHLQNMDKKSRENVDSYKLRGRVTSYIKPKIMSTSSIIQNQAYWDSIFSWIPYRQRLKELHNLFSTEKDGYSIHQLVRKCKDSGSIVLIFMVQPIEEYEPLINNSELEEDGSMDGMEIVDLIKKKRQEGVSLLKLMKENETKNKSNTTDKKNLPDKCIFGVYCGESLEVTHRYSGTTDTFIFSLYPIEEAYKWTRKNDFFVLGKKNSISFGGGGEGPGLTFDESLHEGTTFRSETFDNKPLCPTERFRILMVEGFYLK